MHLGWARMEVAWNQEDKQYVWTTKVWGAEYGNCCYLNIECKCVLAFGWLLPFFSGRLLGTSRPARTWPSQPLRSVGGEAGLLKVWFPRLAESAWVGEDREVFEMQILQLYSGPHWNSEVGGPAVCVFLQAFHVILTAKFCAEEMVN